MIDGPFFITPHAVRRYQERVERDCTKEYAFARLVECAQKARFAKALPDKNGRKCEQWRGPKPAALRLTIVYSDDPSKLPAMVSVKKASFE
jgi:hypothetical protein